MDTYAKYLPNVVCISGKMNKYEKQTKNNTLPEQFHIKIYLIIVLQKYKIL